LEFTCGRRLVQPAGVRQVERRVGPHFASSPYGLPLSNTTRQTFGASNRQIELNRATTFPDRSRTGPVLSANVPDSRTSTASGSQENGALVSAKKRAQPSATCFFPRKGVGPVKKMASSDRKVLKASKLRSAMVLAKARSTANTCSLADCADAPVVTMSAASRKSKVGREITTAADMDHRFMRLRPNVALTRERRRRESGAAASYVSTRPALRIYPRPRQ